MKRKPFVVASAAVALAGAATVALNPAQELKLGFEVAGPMAIAVIGGEITSTALTLLALPGDLRRRGKSGLRTALRAQVSETPVLVSAEPACAAPAQVANG